MHRDRLLFFYESGLLNFRSNARFFLTALLLWLGAGAAAQARNLVTDPLFNDVNAQANAFTYWMLGGGSSVNTQHVYTGSNYSADIHSNNGTVSQTLATTLPANTSYNVTFYMFDHNQSVTYSVTIGGATVTGAAAATNSFQSITAPIITISSSTTAFQIKDTSTNEFWVDDVTLTRTPGPIPGSGALSYIVLALTGFGLRRRHLSAMARSLFAGKDA